jgi:hypothetical protein
MSVIKSLLLKVILIKTVFKIMNPNTIYKYLIVIKLFL